MFDTITALQVLPIDQKDYVIVTCSSGALTILSWNLEDNSLSKDCETLISLPERFMPCHYLSIDPKGTFVTIAGLEELKVVFPLKFGEPTLQLGSPLYITTPHVLLFDLAWIGEDNHSIFACLEVDYSLCDTDPTGEAIQSTTKNVAFYEVTDEIQMLSSYFVPKSANALVVVPGGVLVLADGVIVYVGLKGILRDISIPRRIGLPEGKECMITSHVNVNGRFYLLQNEYGDLFKVTFGPDMSAIFINYYGTIPVAVSLTITNNGLLLCAAESGNQYVVSHYFFVPIFRGSLFSLSLFLYPHV